MKLVDDTILVDVQFVELGVAVGELERDGILRGTGPAPHLRDRELEPVRQDNLRPMFLSAYRILDGLSTRLDQTRNAPRGGSPL